MSITWNIFSGKSTLFVFDCISSSIIVIGWGKQWKWLIISGLISYHLSWFQIEQQNENKNFPSQISLSFHFWTSTLVDASSSGSKAAPKLIKISVRPSVEVFSSPTIRKIDGQNCRIIWATCCILPFFLRIKLLLKRLRSKTLQSAIYLFLLIEIYYCLILFIWH